VGDLLDAILRELPEASMTSEDERGVQIAIVGRPNVGKSSLINRILGQRRLLVDNAPGTTRDAIDSVVRVNARSYTLVDTAGMRKFRQISESLEKAAVTMSLKRIEHCDVAVLLLDAVAGVGAQDTHIATYIERRGKACIIALNKWDIVEKNLADLCVFCTDNSGNYAFLLARSDHQLVGPHRPTCSEIISPD